MIDTIDMNRGTGLARRACEVCGITFAATRAHARYCSAKCKRTVLPRKRHAAGRQRRHRRCPRCGSVFVARRSDGQYCSGACRQAMHRWRHRPEGSI